MNVIAPFFNHLASLIQRPPFISCVTMVILTGCFTDKWSVKDNFRMVPLNPGHDLQARVHSDPPILIFDDGALSPQEHQRLIDDLATLRTDIPLEQRQTNPGQLTQKLNSCRLFVNIGRSRTYYRAVCDAQLQFEAQPLLHLSASAERETRTKGLPPSALKKAAGKNPWMEHQHAKAVTLMAAQKAINHLYQPSSQSPPSFYFTPQKMETALQENNISLLRAIISRMAVRENEEDIVFLMEVVSSEAQEVKGEAIRSLAIKCTALAKSAFEAHHNLKNSVGMWSKRGLACLKAKEKGLMPRRETVPVAAPGS